MNRNVFLKKKVEEKYNPDVLDNFDKLTNNRNTAYSYKNTPYKIIIEDNIPSNIKNQNDLQILVDKNDNTKEKYSELLKNREDLDNKNKKLFSEQMYTLKTNQVLMKDPKMLI